MRFLGIFFIACFLWTGLTPVYAQDISSGSAGEALKAPDTQDENFREYENLVVLLIDAKTGMIGVEQTNDETQETRKLSFEVDPKVVYITNPLNQILELSDIAVGDQLLIYEERVASGKMMVTEILNYNRILED